MQPTTSSRRRLSKSPTWYATIALPSSERPRTRRRTPAADGPATARAAASARSPAVDRVKTTLRIERDISAFSREAAGRRSYRLQEQTRPRLGAGAARGRYGRLVLARLLGVGVGVRIGVAAGPVALGGLRLGGGFGRGGLAVRLGSRADVRCVLVALLHVGALILHLLLGGWGRCAVRVCRRNGRAAEGERGEGRERGGHLGETSTHAGTSLMSLTRHAGAR